MAVVIIDGRVAVAWCTAIANIGQPTAAESNAGTRLETLITPTGLSIRPSTAKVDVGNLASKKNASRAGRVDHDIKLTFHHDGTADIAWDLLPYGTNGFLVVRRGIARETAFAAGQKVAVYAVETGEPDETDPSPSSAWDFTSDLFITELGWESRAVVAA